MSHTQISNEDNSHSKPHGDGCQHTCCVTTGNPSLCQNLDEMDFEKGIWQAALDNNVQRIFHLISYQKVHPDAPDSYGYTALHYAARNGQLEAAKLLLQNGANINLRTKNNGATSLQRAVKANEKEMVKFLLTENADASIQDYDGLTALDCAKRGGHEDLVKLLQPH